MLGVVYHDVDQQLVDPHVLGDVGAVAVTLQSVGIVRSTLTRDVVVNL